jgi:PAS domain-containing protein
MQNQFYAKLEAELNQDMPTSSSSSSILSSSPTTTTTTTAATSISSNSAASKKTPGSNKKGPSCHHCRQSHIGCDGQRPCQNCVRKNKICFDYDKKLIRKAHLTKNTSSRECSADGISCAVLRREMEALREQLHRTEKESEELKTQNRILLQLLNHNRNTDLDMKAVMKEGQELQDQKQGNEFMLYQVPRNEYTLTLWDPPLDLQKPIVVFETTQFRVIGCNQAFKELTGYSTEDLQKLTLYEMVPQRLRQAWKVLLQWVMCSSVRTLENTGIVLFKDNREKCVRMKRYVEKNFMRVEYELTNIFTDAFIIDDIHLPETFKMPYDEQFHQNTVTIPANSFQRLLDLLMKLKFLREQESNQRWTQNTMVQPQANLMAFKSVEMQENDLRKISHDPLCQIMSNSDAPPRSIFSDAEENSNELSLVVDCENFDLPQLASQLAAAANQQAPLLYAPYNGLLSSSVVHSSIPNQQQQLLAVVNHSHQQQPLNQAQLQISASSQQTQPFQL